MTIPVLNPNLTDLGYSRDNLMAATLRMGSRKALVRNSPEFCWMCRDRGIETIYRNTNDGYIPRDSEVASFVASRLFGDWAHALNEVGWSPEHNRFNKLMAIELEKYDKKGVFYNASTHQSNAQWVSAESTIAWLIERGHAIGVHVYREETDRDQYAWNWVPLMQKYGGTWFITEYGYIRNIEDANRGWRGSISEHEYASLLKSWEIPNGVHGSFIFSLEHWPIGDTETGFAIFDSGAILDACSDINKDIPVKHEFLYNARVTNSGVRLRDGHSTSGTKILGKLPLGEIIDVYSSDPVPADNGYTWWYVNTSIGEGWTASPINGIPTFTRVEDTPLTLRSPFNFPSKISAKFGGPRTYPGYPNPMRHEGVDLVPDGDQCAPVVVACADGVVDKFAYNGTGYGYYVRLDHGNGWYTWYGHLAYPAFVCKAGQKVKAGDIIGLMGSTGNSTGPHLHLTVQHEGFGITSPEYVLPDVIDPLSIIEF